ncbi:formylmethanofuran dehydrogenase [Caldimonas tepidiphila]|uniref:formylmethanofuran dehydrogenase n=1 Tax=Caldimonas tepidiphila TaxID=2315841 RepID=UPI000E5BAF11|nr:formylmethanofuran dehydrogenase [Caldimonas tepidiphila]
MDDIRAPLPTPADPVASPWTCPFCSLHCDAFGVEPTRPPRLVGSDCPRAHHGLSHFANGPATAATARLHGAPVPLEQALDAAAQWLARSRRPLFGGLATDVAGGRALYRLAARSGAIADHAHGRALMHAVRAQQDRGVHYTTLAEIRNRADLIVCLGTQPSEHYPEFFRRCGIGEELLPARHLAFVGAAADPALDGLAGVGSESVPLQGELFETLAVLNALVAQRPVPRASAPLAALAERLRAASYAVIVWEAGRLPRHGALVAEGVHQLVGTLNRHTRAAGFSLGGSDGAYAVNQAWTWLSGLPLRTKAGPLGLEHEPERFDAQRLLDEGSVDLLLWVSSFGPGLVPPALRLPRIVLGHPALPLPHEDGSVFIPVATPGIGAAGHLFRTDGAVVLPLTPLWQDALPTVAEVLTLLNQRLDAGRPA